MRKIALLAITILLLTALSACEQARPKDPLEVISNKFFQHCKMVQWDDAYGMLSADSQKYYKKEKFVEDASMFIKPKVDSLYITRIEKHKLDALVFTEFKPKSSWETYNTMESAKVKVNYVYRDGKWKVHYPEIVSKGQEEEQIESERKARSDKWNKAIKFNKFNVENKITDDGPKLVFTGEWENVGEEAVEMAMVKVQFFDGNDKEVYAVVVVPQYLSRHDPDRKPFAPKEKREFVETISSRIPDTWSGKVKYFIWDAGKMPGK